MKIKVQAQHLQPGDIVGSGEEVFQVILNSISWPSNKCMVHFKCVSDDVTKRTGALWSKYTMINVERKADGV